MDKKKIGIIGATGYTGSELVRLLKNHPQIEIAIITSESHAGKKFSDVHPFFQGIEEQILKTISEIDDYNLDLVFLALPHGVSMNFVKDNANKSFKIIDLSGDFRLSSKAIYEEWYGMEHIYPEGIGKSAFGLPELFEEQIKKANLVANPGCFPTSAILAIAPLLKGKYIDGKSIIIDSKTGVTGAGIKPKAVNLYSNVNDNFKAYGVTTHRHTIEIQSILDEYADDNTLIQFTPHLLPVDRGILSTIYLTPTKLLNQEELDDIYKAFYKTSPFVRIREQIPEIKDVRGTNYCDIHVTYDQRTNRIIVISVIDNLMKGASGQAVANMNLMFDFDQTTGLNQIPVNP